jgi:hypothetical protein
MAREAATMDIERYKLLVDRCARERLDYIISNGSPMHARVLIAKLFDTARQSASIVSGQLIDATSDGAEVYGYNEVIASAFQFLRRAGTKLQIILEQPIHLQLENRFLKAVVDDVDRKGSVVIYPATAAVNITRTPHLMVTDALAYRLELDNKDVQAFANFGDNAGAASVINLFNSLEGYVQQIGKHCLTFLPGQRLALP